MGSRNTKHLEPLGWYPDMLVLRWRAWLDARRGRRRALWLVGLIAAFVVFPAIVGIVVATAQPGSGVSQIDGLAWMNVRDSQGVPLASYKFDTDAGNILNPANTVLWTLLGVEFVGYMAIVTSAIWVITFTFSFEWLDMFASALSGTAQALVRQIATPMVLITAATIGAFFVAWFVARGLPTKATMQVLTMLGVAVLGPIFLASPLEDVLSSDGLLVKGRDVGLSVAAGLNGNGNPNPQQLVSIMQHDLADNFARKPVQVWNFGHVVDNVGSCEAAWTSSVMSGGDVKEAMESCGNGAAHEKATNPSVGQLGTGLILLICSTMLMLFAVYLGLKVTKAALDTIYHGFMTIFGFAAGGFIYGPTQTFLVRNIVDAFIASAKMAAFTVFLGIYLLFLGNVFDQAQGQVMSVIVIACAIELVAISQVRRLNSSLERGNNWIANRFSLAIQGGSAGGGGGGGSALGMGGAQLPGGGGGGMSGLAALAALNTVNASPVIGWLAGRTPNPLNPLARGKKMSDLANIQTAGSRMETYAWTHNARANWRDKAQRRAEPHGGVTDSFGLANALDGLGDSRVPDAHIAAIIRDLGGSHTMIQQGQRAAAVQTASMSKNPYGFAPLQKAVAAAYAVENHMDMDQPLEARRAFAAQATIAANNFIRHTNRPAPGAVLDQNFISRVRRHWDSDAALMRAITPEEWNRVGRNTRWAIGREVTEAYHGAVTRHMQNPTDANRREMMRWTNRVANLDHMSPDMGLDPWDS